MFTNYGDVARCASLAYKLWEMGWSKEKNASDQYNEFGNDVHLLCQNLQQLQNVFKNVQEGSSSVIPGNSKFYDVLSLNTILEDPFITIAECQQLLKKNRSYAARSGPVQNISWNVTVAAEVALLHNKIRFHNLKILALLMPLQIKLMLDIKDSVHTYGEAMLQQLAALEARIFQDAPPTTQSNNVLRCDDIKISDFLKERFELSSSAGNKDLDAADIFPMRDGIDTFLLHYREAPVTATFSGFILLAPTQSPEQYLRMMKTTWIIQCVVKLPEYLLACQSGNRLLKCFVEGLCQKCVDEFNQFAQKPPGDPLKVRDEPTEETLRSMSDEAYSIWPKKLRIPDRFEETSMDEMNVIMRAPLQHENRSRLKEFILSRKGEHLLQIMTKETSQTDQSTDSQSQQINLETVSIQPIYADPNNTSQNRDINLGTYGSGAAHEQLNFQRYIHLYQFQQAITGYSVIKDFLGVETTIQEGSNTTKWASRVQLWSSSSVISPSSSTPTTPSALTLSSQMSSSLSSRRLSSQSHGTSSSPPATTRENSTRSTGTQVSYLSNVTSLEGSEASSFGAGNIDARVLEQPLQPYLVIFLRPRMQRSGPQHLTLLRIPLSESTHHLDLSSCRCNSSNKSLCNHSEVTGPKKLFKTSSLLVNRYSSASVNLALLGAWHEHKDRQAETKLNFVSFRFKSAEDRRAFEDTVPQLTMLLTLKKNAYHTKKNSVGRDEALGIGEE